jgi:hypothetical protein
MNLQKYQLRKEEQAYVTDLCYSLISAKVLEVRLKEIGGVGEGCMKRGVKNIYFRQN